ncbi:oxoglutarate-dependent flavonoid 7-O-demethylase 1-like [Vicia villosa]|uniref:oxoglutarate-dependent flavonoid 7-O-demethylase 1-like n=1 Tax=Vicia villosa TaxID=3911 RepID=UPI00273C7D34|nr:oxoglutarate-dependent flavonoid 7-O-demethylase 1-like [Vicia villosa]
MSLNETDVTQKNDEAPTFPFIQESVKNDPFKVPQRYTRSEEVIQKSLFMPQLTSQLPVIDFALLLDRNKDELSKLDTACKEWGFFQIVNHGVEIDLMQRMKEAAAEFFESPIEKKIKYAMPPGGLEGYGHAPVDWSDRVNLTIYPTRLRQLPFWPEELKDIIEAYSSEIRRVAEQLIKSVSLLLGLEEHVLLGLHKELCKGLRANYYPPCNAPENVIGLSSHCDIRTLIVGMQDDNATGTQIRYKGGWVPIKTIPGALLINVGDVIEIWSNGRYKSVEHRVQTNKNKRRITFVSFLYPRDDAEIGPFEHLIDDQNPKMYKEIAYGDYFGHVRDKKLAGKTHVRATKINEF